MQQLQPRNTGTGNCEETGTAGGNHRTEWAGPPRHTWHGCAVEAQLILLGWHTLIGIWRRSLTLAEIWRLRVFVALCMVDRPSAWPAAGALASCNTGSFHRRSTFEHPTCMALTGIVHECCRGSNGEPWPPLPRLRRRRVAASAPVTRLSAADVPSLADLGLSRGKALDTTRAHPFGANFTGTSAVCAVWDGHTREEALREWLDHHRCALRWQLWLLRCNVGTRTIRSDVRCWRVPLAALVIRMKP